ncbi:MAG: hypothetical protein AABZ39_12530 [Spirochaetota bacterium]
MNLTIGSVPFGKPCMRGLMPRILRIPWYELEDHGLPVSASWTTADNKAEPEFNFGVYRSDGSGKLILQRMQNYDPTDDSSGSTITH